MLNREEIENLHRRKKQPIGYEYGKAHETLQDTLKNEKKRIKSKIDKYYAGKKINPINQCHDEESLVRFVSKSGFNKILNEDSKYVLDGCELMKERIVEKRAMRVGGRAALVFAYLKIVAPNQFALCFYVFFPQDGQNILDVAESLFFGIANHWHGKIIEYSQKNFLRLELKALDPQNVITDYHYNSLLEKADFSIEKIFDQLSLKNQQRLTLEKEHEKLEQLYTKEFRAHEDLKKLNSIANQRIVDLEDQLSDLNEDLLGLRDSISYRLGRVIVRRDHFLIFIFLILTGLVSAIILAV